MAINPIQYMQPKQFGLEEGLKIGNVIQGIRARNLKQEQTETARIKDEALKKQYSSDIGEYLKNPTPKGAATLTLKYPQQKDAFKQSMGMISDDEKNNQIKFTGQVYSALLNNKPDIALKQLNERIDLRKEAGEDVTDIEMLRDNMVSDPAGAKGYAGMFLSSVMGPEKFTDTFGKLGEEERKEAKLPGELKKQTAELSKYADELGFSGAKKNKLLAETKKLDADTRKILLELESKKTGAGKITDPKDLFKAEQALRKEYSKEIEDYTKTQDAFRKIDAAEDTAVGDLSLIFSFMKMLDPGSVVREGEFATAQNAAGVDQKVLNLYNRILTGERLSKKQRASFKSQSKSLLSASEKKENSARATLTKAANTFGINPDNVFGEPQQTKPKATTKTITVDY